MAGRAMRPRRGTRRTYMRHRSCATTMGVFGLAWNEVALVVFLFVLITSWGWLPRVGEWIGGLFDGPDKTPPSDRGSGGRAPRGEPPASS